MEKSHCLLIFAEDLDIKSARDWGLSCMMQGFIMGKY